MDWFLYGASNGELFLIGLAGAVGAILVFSFLLDL